MSGDFQATKDFYFKSHKVSWPAFINCPGHFISLNPVSISSTGATIALQKKGSYSGRVTLGNLAREELLDGKQGWET